MEPGTIVVHNLPKDFAERELKEYFEQFGTVTALRVSRSRKTRGTRGYAYVEFQCKDVAVIAAQSMDNYLMFGRVLKCQFMPRDSVNSKLFHGSNNQKTTVARHKSLVNKPKTIGNLSNIMKRRRKMLSTSQAKLARFGIQFQPVIINFPDMEILESMSGDEESNLKTKVAKAKKVNLEPSTKKVQAKNAVKSEALPVEKITLKAKKKVLRKRLRTDL